MAIGKKMKTRGSNIGMLSANPLVPNSANMGSFSGSNPYNFFSTDNLGMPTLDNPFPNLNTNSNNLLSQEFSPQTNQQNLSTVADNLNRRQGIANLLFALSDAFAGRDIGTGFLTRQAAMLPEEKDSTEQIKNMQLDVLETLQGYDGTFEERVDKLKKEQPAKYGFYKNYIEKTNQSSFLKEFFGSDFNNNSPIDLGNLK